MGKMKRIFRMVSRSRIVRSVLALVVLVSVFAAGVRTGQAYTPPIVTEQMVIPPAKVELFNPLIEGYILLKRFYYGSEFPSDAEILEAAFKGMVKAFPPELAEYIYYHNPTRAKVVNAEMSGEYAGIGVYLTTENANLVISALHPGGPAEKAGLKPGDIITAVDGVNVVGVSWDVRHSLFRGKPGSEVTISVFRTGEGNLEFKVKREIIETSAIRATKTLANGRIGYIHLTIFSESAADELRKALEQLIEGDKVKGLILDLRGNPGGYQHIGVRVVSQFLDGGKVVTVIYSADGEQKLYSHYGGIATKIPLVVLIDEGSASASELLAGALQDHGRAVLIGTTTHGKGVGQITKTLSDGSALAVVNHEFRTPLGRKVHGIGIQPDIFVPTNPAQRMRGQDLALDRAVEELLKKIDKK